jgi:hypothetical protein
MDLHVLHDEVALEVYDERPGRRRDLLDLLDDLSFVRASGTMAPCRLTLAVHLGVPAVSADGRVLRQSDDLHLTESGEDVFITEGESLFHVQSRQRRATAQIAPSFDERPLQQRHRFWAYGVVKLLQQQGLHALHAAGVATPRGENLLIVGPSGSGKSTMTIGLIRIGGRFLSDDTILLRAAADGVDALTFRKPFSVVAARATDYPDFIASFAPGSRGRKRRADALRAYRSQHLPGFRPHTIVVPRIVSQPTSELRPLSRSVALRHLLAQSGPALFDRSTMSVHLDVLGRLLRQTTSYELLAGEDLHQTPQRLIDLLEHMTGTAWPGSSSN